jgi:hypothetical protein
MPAMGDHRRHIGVLGWRQIGEIRVPFREEVPSAAAVRKVRQLKGIAAGINGLDLLDFRRLAAHGYCHPVIANDVRELLTVAIDQKIERPTFVGIADDCGLRPAIWPYGGNRHDPIGIEDVNRGLLHSSIPIRPARKISRASAAAFPPEHKQ